LAERIIISTADKLEWLLVKPTPPENLTPANNFYAIGLANAKKCVY
jgi:hypothetical protein